MIESYADEERERRQEFQALLDRKDRLESLAHAYISIANERENTSLIESVVKHARILAPRGRVALFESGQILLAEDVLGPCEMTINPEWRITKKAEGNANDLIAPLYDGKKNFIAAVLGKSRRILYIDDLDTVDQDLQNDFASYASFAEIAMAAVTASERDRVAAMTDMLTGLANRRALEKTISRLIPIGKPFAYVIIDLDNFKQINDTQGHAAGDALLKRVGDVLNANIRTSDFPARLAGDEFVVIIGSGDTSIAAIRVAKWLEKNGIGASTGIGRFPQDGNTTQDLYKAADQQLYLNKTARRAAGLR